MNINNKINPIAKLLRDKKYSKKVIPNKKKSKKDNYLKRKSGMPRPNKILEPTKQYNIMLKVEQYDKLAKMATIMQQSAYEQVSVADLIRESVDIYIEAYEEEDEN